MTTEVSRWPTDLERQLLAWACQQDLETFARVGLGFTDPSNPKGRWWTDDVHKPLCAWLQAQILDWLATRSRPDAKRRFVAVLVPRNCAKSLLITRAAMVWAHLQDPNLTTYIGNEKLELAEEFLGTIKGWLQGNQEDHCLFSWLFGNWRGSQARWRSDSLVHRARTQDRSKTSFGIWSPNSALTGRHPDILCMDDLVSYDALKKDLNWFEFAYEHMTDLIPVMEPNGLMLLVGTRYSDADPFGRAFKSSGIATLAGHTSFPEYQPRKNGRWHVYFLSARSPVDNSPVIPAVWPEDEMLHYEGENAIKFAAQVLNRPLAHKLRALTEAQFDARLTNTLPPPRKTTLIFHLDTAFKRTGQAAGGSETAFLAAGHHDDEPGLVTVFDAHTGANFKAGSFADFLLERYRYWRSEGYTIAGFTDEAEMAGKSGIWGQFLSDHFEKHGETMPHLFVFNRQSGEKKELRIANAIAFIAASQVFFYEKAEHLQQLRYQLCNFPGAHPADLSDAFADTYNPEFYSGFLPSLIKKKEEYPWSAHEQRLKPGNRRPDDIMDDEMDRPPIRRGAPGRGASPRHVPFSEQGSGVPSFILPRPRR